MEDIIHNIIYFFRKLVKTLPLMVLFLGYSVNSWAFTCQDATGNVLETPDAGNGNNVGYANVNLQPTIGVGENMLVDLNSSISCQNDKPGLRNDMVSLLPGSNFGGSLSSLTGDVQYYGALSAFPTVSETAPHNFTSGALTPWNVQLFIKPSSAMGNVVIKAGSLIATLLMHQVGSDVGTGANQNDHVFTWYLYANNDVVMPVGGCQVISARDVTVTLPDYPGGKTPVPLTVTCNQNQNLSYYITGPTADAGHSIFTNTAASSPAQGVGVQLNDSNGGVIATNVNTPLGIVGPSPVNLGLTASYALTGGQMAAGNVQSVISVTFVYP
jgi:minor fimbrial subunit